MTKWHLISIGDCCEIVSGSTPKTTKKSFWDGDILWVTPKDLSQLEGKFISETSRKITEEGLESCAASLLPVDSVLFSSRAPIGHVAINKKPMATNQGFKSLIPKRAMVDPNFLYYWLRGNREYLESLGNGATFKELSKSVFSKVKIPLPPLEEQRRIADILDRADALRRLRRESLARLDELTRSIFLDMFGDPATNPKGWPVRNFASLLRVSLRNGLSPSHGGKVIGKVLTLSAITGDRFDDTAWKESTFVSIPPLEQSVDAQDFLICRGNGNLHLVGRGYFPLKTMKNITFPDTMIAAKMNEMLAEKGYIQNIWSTDYIRGQIERFARTTNGTYKINQGMIEKILIPLPPLPLQQEFARRVEAVERLKDGQREHLARLDELFASLQHRAFRGEL